MAVSVTANAASTPLGGTGSAAQAGATGSSGGTTTGTVACSSCCAPQGRYLIDFFGGYGQAGLCPGAVDNSQPFPVYYTFVLSMNSPYTAAQFCLPTSFTLTATAYNFYWVNLNSSTCSTISPPATTGNVVLGAYSIAHALYLNTFLCACFFPTVEVNPIISYSLVSCSPPVFSVSCKLFSSFPHAFIGTAAITITF